MKLTLIRNAITGLYWDGTPDSFQSGLSTAKAEHDQVAAFIKATYENVELVETSLIPTETLRAAYAALPITAATQSLLKDLAARCAGMTPLFTGRDLSGKRLRKINATDNADWVEYFGRQIACECKKTTFKGDWK